jgi:hypothetical protein
MSMGHIIIAPYLIEPYQIARYRKALHLFGTRLFQKKQSRNARSQLKFLAFTVR